MRGSNTTKLLHRETIGTSRDASDRPPKVPYFSDVKRETERENRLYGRTSSRRTRRSRSYSRSQSPVPNGRQQSPRRRDAQSHSDRERTIRSRHRRHRSSSSSSRDRAPTKFNSRQRYPTERVPYLADVKPETQRKNRIYARTSSKLRRRSRSYSRCRSPVRRRRQQSPRRRDAQSHSSRHRHHHSSRSPSRDRPPTQTFSIPRPTNEFPYGYPVWPSAHHHHPPWGAPAHPPPFRYPMELMLRSRFRDPFMPISLSPSSRAFAICHGLHQMMSMPAMMRAGALPYGILPRAPPAFYRGRSSWPPPPRYDNDEAGEVGPP